MSELVITADTTVKCNHLADVTLSSAQSTLRIEGSFVLVDGDLPTKPVVLCPHVPNSNTSDVTCATVKDRSGGAAAALMVDGKAVLLESASGKTTGKDAGTDSTWSVITAGQQRLKAE